MPTECLTKQLFLYRLNLYAVRDFNHQLEFIPDIFRIPTKYKLMKYITDQLKNSTFPSKSIWKQTTLRALNTYYTDEWRRRIAADDTFNHFRNVHRAIQPSSLWIHSQSRHEIVHAIIEANALSYTDFYLTVTCKLCNSTTPRIMKHILTACISPSAQKRRDSFLADVIIICGKHAS